MRVRMLAVLTGLSLVGCTPSFVEQDQSSVLLTITQITASAGGPAGEEDQAFLLSDVQFVSDEGFASVFNDNATATVFVQSKNPLVDATGTFNAVHLTHYNVRFTRTDGHNVEGIDVPYAFAGPLNVLANVGVETEAAFLLVRHEAKREPPLSNMAGGGGLDLLQTIANITLSGVTTSGKTVTATGRLGVTFGDFGDE